MHRNRLKILGLNIKAERARKSLTQEQLAELADISRSTVSKIETSNEIPNILTIISIAKALEIDINELIKGV